MKTILLLLVIASCSFAKHYKGKYHECCNLNFESQILSHTQGDNSVQIMHITYGKKGQFIQLNNVA